MQSTWQQVLDDARAWLNDTAVAGGVNWPNARLQKYAAMSYRKMFDGFLGIGANRVRHTVYFQLPAYTTLWVPITGGVTDLSEPEILSERISVTTGAISATSTTSPIQVSTVNPHGLSTNTDTIIDNVVETFAPWGRYFISVVGPNDFKLNGSVSDGVAGASGTFSTGSTKFVDMRPVSRSPNFDPSSSLINWWWENNAINFIGSTNDTQVRMIYIASGTAPTNPNTLINIDDCLNFLGCCAAGYALGSVGFPQRSRELLEMALGPKLEADGSAGFLRDLLQPTVLEMAREMRTPKTFRPSKNSFVPFMFG